MKIDTIDEMNGNYAPINGLNMYYEIHGTADSIIPVGHGNKLVEIMPNAKGLWLKYVGHVFPFPDMDYINKNIISNFEKKMRCGSLKTYHGPNDWSTINQRRNFFMRHTLQV